MEGSPWPRFSQISHTPVARSWLTWQAQLGRRPNTIDAYGRALEDYLTFCAHQPWSFLEASREHIASYVRFLLDRSPTNTRGRSPYSSKLANATVQQRIAVVRLFYDYLTEEGIRHYNPVGRGSYHRRKAGLKP